MPLNFRARSPFRFRVLSTWNIMWAQSFRATSFRATYMYPWKHLMCGSILAQWHLHLALTDFPFAPSVIADLVLVLGTKTTRPAFLTMWLIVVGISIVLMVVIASLGIVSFAVGWVEKPHCHLSINSKPPLLYLAVVKEVWLGHPTLKHGKKFRTKLTSWHRRQDIFPWVSWRQCLVSRIEINTTYRSSFLHSFSFEYLLLVPCSEPPLPDAHGYCRRVPRKSSKYSKK